jgi:tetratricopeptide (TPR) repeat protein
MRWDPFYLQKNDGADVDARAYGSDNASETPAPAAEVNRFGDLLDDDGSGDDDGPQCLADILPAPQRAKLNPASHKAAMFIMTADVQQLFSSMARATLQKGTRGRKAKGHLDSESQRIMGQANLEFAMGNYVKSEELCLRVVQLQPHSTQPYSTLSSIYESVGDVRRATDYLLCAAVVKPRDAEIWAQLATKFQELGQPKSALHCLRRASSNRRGDLNLLWSRFEIQSQLHVDAYYRNSLDTLELILRRGVASSPNLPLDPLVKSAAMKLAFEHHKNRKLESAASVLRIYLQATEVRCSTDYDACNLLAECMATLQQWNEMSILLTRLQNQRCAIVESYRLFNSSDSHLSADPAFPPSYSYI